MKAPEPLATSGIEFTQLALDAHLSGIMVLLGQEAQQPWRRATLTIGHTIDLVRMSTIADIAHQGNRGSSIEHTLHVGDPVKANWCHGGVADRRFNVQLWLVFPPWCSFRGLTFNMNSYMV